MPMYSSIKEHGPDKARSKRIWIIPSVIVAVSILAAAFYFSPWKGSPGPSPTPKATEAAPARAESAPGPVIDYDAIKKRTDPTLTELVDRRKQDFGLKDSVDMVANRDETIKVGSESVSVKEILDLIAANPVQNQGGPVQPGSPGSAAGDLSESPLAEGQATGEGAQASPLRRLPEDFYAFHVVKPGDNLWYIHFAMLREYLNRRGFNVAEDADRRPGDGSPPAARILKYAESMVHVFNIKTKALDPDFKKLKPGEKVVIFNISQLDRFLGSVKPEDFERVRFDGDRLYLAEDVKPAPRRNTP